MTGGTEEAARVNRELSSIAEERGYGFGLGSQRAMHTRADAEPSYSVRAGAPSTLVLGNIGVVQARSLATDEVLALALKDPPTSILDLSKAAQAETHPTA